MTATAEPLERLATEPASRGQWIAGRGFDLAFFTLSPLLGVALLVAEPHSARLLGVIAVTLFGVPHYLSTFTFFLWEENREYYRARWLVFFGGPAMIVVTLALLMLFRVPLIIQVIIYSWNAWHVARQSCGILSIYRHRSGERDLRFRRLTNMAVIGTNFAMAFWNIGQNRHVHEFLTRLHADLPVVLRGALAVLAAYALVRLGVALVERHRTQGTLHLPELAFLGASLALFHPYLWIKDSDQATLGMLMGHFVQYLGVVWLVHRRRFGERASGAPRPLAIISQSLPLLLVTLVTAGAVFFVIDRVSLVVPPMRSLYLAVFITLSLVHFYLDGLFWAFSNPHVRKTLGPLLLSRR